MHELTFILKVCFCFLVYFLVTVNLNLSFQKSNPFSYSRISGLNGGCLCFPAIYTCAKLPEALLERTLKAALFFLPLTITWIQFTSQNLLGYLLRGTLLCTSSTFKYKHHWITQKTAQPKLSSPQRVKLPWTSFVGSFSYKYHWWA